MIPISSYKSFETLCQGMSSRSPHPAVGCSLKPGLKAPAEDLGTLCAAGAMAETGSDLGARLSDNARESDGLGQGGVDVPDLPVRIPGHAAAPVSADCHVALPAEHQVCHSHKALSLCVVERHTHPVVVSQVTMGLAPATAGTQVCICQELCAGCQDQ